MIENILIKIKKILNTFTDKNKCIRLVKENENE